MTDNRNDSDNLQKLRRQAEERIRTSRQALPEADDSDEETLLEKLKVHQVELEMQNEELLLTQAELSASRAEYADLYDFAPVGYLSLDQEGRILKANLTTASLLGNERNRLQGQPFVVHIVAEDRDIFYNHLRKVARQGERDDCELRLVKKSGETFYAHLESVPVKNGKGTKELRTSLLDITERKQLEEELIRSQKYEALELMAGGIAHDFNNLLTIMLGNISLTQSYIESGKPPGEKLGRLEQTVLRSRDLVQKLMMISGSGNAGRQVWDTAALIRETTELPLESTGCRHELELADDLWAVTVDQVQFSQVLQNLIINAGQAMPDGGTITIRAENMRLDRKKPPRLAAGNYVRISVEDQGGGIPSKLKTKIFDPYFSTKPGGSGLGLAVSHALIEKSGGQLSALSKPGGGASFEIILPAAAVKPEEAETKEKEAADVEQPQTSSDMGRILVMDDEQMIRDLASELLKFLGYDVEVADEGGKALELFKKAKEDGRPFAAVILDLLVVNGMEGQETMEKLLEIDPEVKAIVSSGYTKHPVAENFADYGFAASMPKPYSLKQLSTTLREILATDNAG